MKKLIYYIAILLYCSSCEKYLEVEPTNVFAMKTYEDVKSLMGAHIRSHVNVSNSSKLPGTTIHYRNNNFYLLFHFYGDDLNTGKYLDKWIGNNNKKLYNESMDWKQETETARIWKENYANIGFYNTILDELANIDGVTEDQANIIKGEAKFLRAWNLFKLLQYFSPYKLDKYGLPVNFDSQAVGSYNSQRKTQTEVYQLILADLTEVLDYKTVPTTYNCFYDKKIIHALLAEVYHFKGGSGAAGTTDYEQAITHAKAAMEGRTLQKLNDYTPFPLIESGVFGFYKDKQQALIFDTRSDGSAMQGLIGVPAYGPRARLYQFTTDALYQLFDDKDVRKGKFFGPNKEIFKFEQIDPEGSGSMGRSIYQIFSMPEMQLIMAESYARKGDLTNAKLALEELQRNRIEGYTSYSGSDVLQEILNERRREFCFEYDMRWCDLIRTQKGYSHDWAKNKETPTVKIEDNDYRFCFPIPLNEELQYNKIEQNPGWNF
ncbi:MAG: RagB/SusD family nutrient uptake outer membrane protein [Odoribacter sp.]